MVTAPSVSMGTRSVTVSAILRIRAASSTTDGSKNEVLVSASMQQHDVVSAVKLSFTGEENSIPPGVAKQVLSETSGSVVPVGQTTTKQFSVAFCAQPV
eukprot:scaffold22_cov50-Attheya_sp.AAC.6